MTHVKVYKYENIGIVLGYLNIFHNFVFSDTSVVLANGPLVTPAFNSKAGAKYLFSA